MTIQHPEDASDHTDDDALSPRGPRTSTRIIAALAILALLAGVGAGLFGVLQPTTSAGASALQQITEAADEQFAGSAISGGGQAALSWSPSVNQAVVVTRKLAPAGADHTYQLWVDRDGAVQSVGTFDPDETGSVAMLLSVPLRTGDTVFATREGLGGSRSGAPTGSPLFEMRVPGANAGTGV